MARRLRVGILGAGEAGTGHAKAFVRLPGVEIVALWSRTRARAQKLAAHSRLSNVRLYDDWQPLVEAQDIDIISLATPATFRCEPFLRALDTGRHVLVEDALCDNLPDALTMVKAARRTRSITALCFNWRYVPGTQALCREIRKGAIGSVL